FLFHNLQIRIGLKMTATECLFTGAYIVLLKGFGKEKNSVMSRIMRNGSVSGIAFPKKNTGNWQSVWIGIKSIGRNGYSRQKKEVRTTSVSQTSITTARRFGTQGAMSITF